MREDGRMYSKNVRKIGWENNIKMDLKEIGLEVWIGFIWLRIRSSGGFL
jgi:hypothetical protein